MRNDKTRTICVVALLALLTLLISACGGTLKSREEVTGGGMLSGSSEDAGIAVDLSAEGTLDWAHWGLENADSFNHKSGTGQISDITGIEAEGLVAIVTQYSDDGNQFTWADGDPTESVADSTTGIYIVGTGNGFEFTVPADIILKTLKVYVSVRDGTGEIEATLSDDSATPYVDTIEDTAESGWTRKVFTINFQAAEDGQTLIVRYILKDSTEGGGVALQAATLAKARKKEGIDDKQS